MTLLQILGLTNYLFGKDHFSSYAAFKLQRYFVDNFRVTQGNLDFRTQPTWQNFKHDELLANAKANGQFNIWCTQGAFDWQGVQGKQGKVMPIRDADNPLDQNSWKDIGALVKQIAIRYADDTSHLLSEAKVFQGSPTYLSNTPKAGMNLVDAIEIQNEWDFKASWSGATRTITPEEYAVCFKVCYDSIRSVSNTMRIIMGGGISPIESTFTRFLIKLTELYAAEGKEMPKDFFLCFHWYMRNGSSDQGGGTAGITPEEAKAYEFGLMMDALCEKEGLLGWYCTETGWATDDSKQSAPILEGFTREQSQGILMIRLALIWGACKYHKGISFWHVRDDYDSPPYAKGGVNYKDWSAKPARTICEAFLDTYGYYEVTQYTKQGEIHSVKLTKGTDVKQLSWTDKKNISNVTPIPNIVTVIPPTEPPNPPTMARKIFITTGTIANYDPVTELTEGKNVPLGNYALYVDGEPPVTLSVIKEGGAVVIPVRTEGGKPLAFGGDDSGKLRPLALTQGAHIVKVSGQPDLKFTVGAATPPPPVDIKGTEFFKTSQGKVKFKFADNTEVILP